MRVTEKMIFEGTLATLGTSRNNLAEAQDELSSGKRVQAPGDDPAAAALVVRHRVEQSRLDAIGTTAQRAADELNAADSALDGVDNLLARAQQLATQLGNDTYGAEDRASAATEVDGLFSQAVELLNTRYAGRYLFGGFQDASPPFDATGAYHGDNGVRQVEIAPGLFEDASVRADTTITGAGGGANLLTTLTDLANAMRANDGTAIRATLGSFDQVGNQIATARTRAGTAVNVFQGAVDQCGQGSDQEKVLIGKLADADVLDASTRLSAAQTSLDATLTAAAKTFQLSLVDYLK